MGSLLCGVHHFRIDHKYAYSSILVKKLLSDVSCSVQGWDSVIPHFTALDFVSYYIEIPVMIVMYLVWLLLKRIPLHLHKAHSDSEDTASTNTAPTAGTPLAPYRAPRRVRWFDLVDTKVVDLYRDEHHETTDDTLDDEERDVRLSGRWRWAWTVYYLVA